MPRDNQILQKVQAGAIDLRLLLTPCGLDKKGETEKAPFLPEWPVQGSCDPKQLATWAADPRTLHFGLICGPVNRTFVVDFDIEKDKESPHFGKFNLGNLQAEWFSPPPLRRRTPSGGWHYFYEWEPRLDDLPNHRIPGTSVDLRGQGTQVVLYGELPDESIWKAKRRPMPDALYEGLKRLCFQNGGGGKPNWNIGHRNPTLNRELFIAISRGDEAAAAKILIRAKEAGLGEKEIAATAKSATRGAIKKGAVGRARAKERGAVVYVPVTDDDKADLEARLKALKFEARHNARADKKEIRASGGKWTAITDGAEASLYLRCKSGVVNHSGARVKLTKWAFNDALAALAHENQVDPFESYLKGLKWDGTPRLENFTENCFEVTPKHKPLARWALKSIMGGAVARAFKPGTEHQEFFCFQGAQGIGKSSFLRALFEDASLFSSTIDLSNYQKCVEGMIGKVICECSELSGIRKAEIEALKTLISTRSDYIRLSYRRNAQDYPRRAVLCGTTNAVEALPNDLSGLRRFCLVSLSQSRAVEEIVKIVRAERRQLWAEVVQRWKDKKSARLPVKLWDLSAEIAEAARGGNELLENGVQVWIEAENTAADEYKAPEDQNRGWLGDFAMEDCTLFLKTHEPPFIGPNDAKGQTLRDIGDLLRLKGFEKYQATGGKKRWRRKKEKK